MPGPLVSFEETGDLALQFFGESLTSGKWWALGKVVNAVGLNTDIYDVQMKILKSLNEEGFVQMFSLEKTLNEADFLIVRVLNDKGERDIYKIKPKFLGCLLSDTGIPWNLVWRKNKIQKLFVSYLERVDF